MTDNYFDDIHNEPTQDMEKPSETDFGSSAEAVEESSYEWNSAGDRKSGEYHYSFVKGGDIGSDHDPNRYDRPVAPDTSYGNRYGSHYYGSSNPYSSDYSSGKVNNPESSYEASAPAAKKVKKTPKSASRGFVAAALAVAILASGAIGVSGGYLMAKYQNDTSSSSDSKSTKSASSSKGTLNITEASSSSPATSTSEIVQKTANSVVEIATEGVSTGSFARQYVTKGAGSGVIISADGYIVTNHHVIDGANKITVTLRDGKTNYDAEIIGSDADNDIALLKIDATDLSAATFGDSSNLVVGDYVVAIGNPLGTLGGTVTDGIISALAREVTIEDKNLTLLQTNAQISPGNSGGGLFNANGELVGIVNAKDSATEVEGIAFAIPSNTAKSIITDLMEYGYVTGKVSLGMEFVEVNSDYAAFYYGVQDKGVYVLSVESDSNAEKAGFKRGDLISEVNGTSVSSEDEIKEALKDSKVGDTATFTIKRDRKSSEIEMKLAEYVPSTDKSSKSSNKLYQYNSDDSWRDSINW